MCHRGIATRKSTGKIPDVSRTGYQDPKNPNWLLCNLNEKAPCPCFSGKASGHNMAFDVQINDLTLDTGKGNPGAIGLHYICHNTGGLKNLSIRSGDGAGFIGLDLRHPWNGPCLMKGLTISGFDYGIWTKFAQYHDTFEDITLENQKVAGMRVQEHAVSIRHLVSRNKVPALVIESGKEWKSQVVLLDADLRGGAADATAIVNDGGLYLRNCTVAGYQTAVGGARPGPADKTIKEWNSEEWTSLFPTAKHSLNLPVKDTPEFPYEPLNAWESVRKHTDKVVNGDWGPAIQAAIDSGKTTVYFPKAANQKDAKGKDDWTYPIRSTVIVRGAVRVIQGCGSTILADDMGLAGKPAFRIDKGTADTVFFEKFTWEGKGLHLEHAARTLVMQQCRWQRIANAAGCGDLFVDCWGGTGTFSVPQKVFVRALNMEAGGEAKMVNAAADLWVLGLKTEGDATNLHNLAGGRAEILGGMNYPAARDFSKKTGFINEGGALSVIIATMWPHKTAFQETVGGTTKTLPDPGRFWNYVYLPGSAK